MTTTCHWIGNARGLQRRLGRQEPTRLRHWKGQPQMKMLLHMWGRWSPNMWAPVCAQSRFKASKIMARLRSVCPLGINKKLGVPCRKDRKEASMGDDQGTMTQESRGTKLGSKGLRQAVIITRETRRICSNLRR
jgi:hypothetical protein